MGQIKKQKKMYARPKKPYDNTRFLKEKNLAKSFGLRKKQEIWKAESMLRNFRARAKNILANPNDMREKELFDKLNMMGIKIEKIDDVLDIKAESLLSRRLQSVVVSKKLADTPKEARQLIVHGHVLIDGKRASYPGMLVTTNMEDAITLDEKTKTRMIAEVKQ